ncbi:Pimeloyl-ACP methyl ester carboxylesterase [Geosporobacter subterraneus DSM 17957]|uniref:Pimeloyl-ACP methyl ester carboxylesterase n=1 Tax=Geosporobacter subterraneus DSM 17957 TaxID=1121919 RepID=A0A1M6IMQ6_9FIRM|nr:alpha/beta hydrolase [Geosporobacter subterraneus]SHJ35737.1 Pimeloyl-ACP methyl ester carboxylesterase [Geosporobacter subterraneus DSM 17957]
MLFAKKITFIYLCICLFCLIIIFKEIAGGYTQPIKDEKGDIIQESITSLEKVMLGDMEQWILIRGKDIKNPILLWLHGGPGAAQMPISYYFNSSLEETFTVVHWDQRGAGKSNPGDFDEETMRIEQFICDAHQLTKYLQTRFGKEKIYLLGHSWGAKLGILLAEEYPEDYYAYIAVSQPVDTKMSNEVAYGWLKEQAEDKKNKKDIVLLNELELSQLEDHKNYVVFAGLVDRYGGGMDIGMGKLATIALRAPEYRLSDYIRWIRGASRGSGPMWEQYIDTNPIERVTALSLPIYFFSGRKDYNTPFELVGQYYIKLNAPVGKQLVVFEESAHAPFMAEPEKFYQEMLRVKEETYPY